MQQVNLLTDELRPNVEPLMGLQLAVVWSAFIGLLILFTSWQGLSAWLLEDDLAHARREVDAIQKQIAELKSSAESNVLELTADLERLRLEQIERQELVMLFRTYQRRDGFSGHLESLARAHVDGLWLEEIRFDQSGDADAREVHIKGLAVHPDRVPEYLLSIADDRYFEGQRFDQFTLRVEDDLVEFELVGPARATKQDLPNGVAQVSPQ